MQHRLYPERPWELRHEVCSVSSTVVPGCGPYVNHLWAKNEGASSRPQVRAVLLLCRNSTDTAYFQRLRPYPRVLLRRTNTRFKGQPPPDTLEN